MVSIHDRMEKLVQLRDQLMMSFVRQCEHLPEPDQTQVLRIWVEGMYFVGEAKKHLAQQADLVFVDGLLDEAEPNLRWVAAFEQYDRLHRRLLKLSSGIMAEQREDFEALKKAVLTMIDLLRENGPLLPIVDYVEEELFQIREGVNNLAGQVSA